MTTAAASWIRARRATHRARGWRCGLRGAREAQPHGEAGTSRPAWDLRRGLWQVPPNDKPRPHLTRGKVPPCGETCPHLRGKPRPRPAPPKLRPEASPIHVRPMAKPYPTRHSNKPRPSRLTPSPASSVNQLHLTRRQSQFIRSSIKPRLGRKPHPIGLNYSPTRRLHSGS